MNGKIVVVGSSNTDLIMKMQKFPEPGETIIGKGFVKSMGGKGSNQAVAAKRAGADVTFIAKLGNDEYGKETVKSFQKEGINTEDILFDKNTHSGVAIIWVDEHGENSIVVSSGSNAKLSPADIEHRAGIIGSSDILMTQLEIPIETVKAAIKIAAENKIKIILNPAPATRLDDALLGKINIITPNINEIEILTGIKINGKEDIKKAAAVLNEKGVEYVIITCGKQGVYLYGKGEFIHIESFKVQTIDTTGAGDIFNGVLAASLLENKTLKEAIEFANAAAAISVTRMGAQISAPKREEIVEFLSRQKGMSFSITK